MCTELPFGQMRDEDKLKILLIHWLEHTGEHGEEFRQWARHAEQWGFQETAESLEAAAQEMTGANHHLKAALDTLRGPLKEE